LAVTGCFATAGIAGWISRQPSAPKRAGETALALDIWNGNGNWTGNPADWSTHAVPTSSDVAIIQTGPLVLNTTGAAYFVTVAPGAALSVNDATLTTTVNIANLSGSFRSTPVRAAAAT
jgi:hypothetical protein